MKSEAPFFKHARAVVDSGDIGRGTRIWANVHVMKDVHIGERCNIGEGCFIESGVRIGSDVVVKNNVAIWDGVTIEDRAFIGPNAVFTNELEPRSTFPKEIALTVVKKGASVGANATIVANRIIGEYAMVGAGAVVTHNVPPHRLVYGNPARIQGWVCTCGRKLKFSNGSADCVCERKFKAAGDELTEIR
jgi:acetyltransferase-like isoleucine patch superfamily enzyme